MGYLESETLYNGTGDTTGRIVESYQYYCHAGSVAINNDELISVNLFPTASDSTYPDAPASLAPDTTSYAYAWWDVPGTTTPAAQIQQETTILPIVTTDQNGPGGSTHWTTEEYFERLRASCVAKGRRWLSHLSRL